MQRNVHGAVQRVPTHAVQRQWAHFFPPRFPGNAVLASLQGCADGPDLIPRHVGVLHLPGGHKVYSTSSPPVQKLTGIEEGAIRGIRYERREEDGSEEFEQLYERIQREGTFMEREE